MAPGPDNPLGDRWIGLSQPGYGIHATNSLLSIGLATSHGCIRMHPRDAKELYDKVRIGMPVKIVYEPILIGQSKESDILYLSVFPDIYNKIPDMKQLLMGKLQKYDIEDFVDIDAAESVLASKKGILQPILGSDITLRLNNRLLQLSLPPMMVGKRIMVTSEVLTPMGANIKWKEENKVVEITRGDKMVSFSNEKGNNNSSNSVLIWKGKAILPLREVAEGLGLALKWEPESRSIVILGVRNEVNSKDRNINNTNNVNNDIFNEKDYEQKVRQIEEKF